MNKLISELVKYGITKGLIETDDKFFVINRLVEEFKISNFIWTDIDVRDICCIL